MFCISRSKYTKMTLLNLLIIWFLFSCNAQNSNRVIVGAEQIEHYIHLLEGKNVALVANQTSLVRNVHIVDTLIASNIAVKKVFSPEHGFRGKADAGAHIDNGYDFKTGLPLISLYGKNKKPSEESLQDVDIVVFDIQDVGARFYTYISTLHYVMEACAESQIPVLILDRPNPNGHYVDGPILDTAFQSFVGMHPIPIVHGMTIAEYGKMINGEGWLKNSIECELYVQQMSNYSHNLKYDLPVKPSPNLPNEQSIALYPSLCLFEGTSVSVGRGTTQQFQVVGAPSLDSCAYKFTPVSMEGAKYPKHENETCCGWNLENVDFGATLNLSYLINAYQQYKGKDIEFFNHFFDKLAGSNELRVQIESGWSSEEIKQSWQDGLEQFKAVRNNYLIYQ